MSTAIEAAMNRIADALFQQAKAVQRQAKAAEKSVLLSERLLALQEANLAVTKHLEATLASPSWRQSTAPMGQSTAYDD